MRASLPIQIPFAAVNRRGGAGYREGWHRHHIHPVHLLRHVTLGPFLETLRREGLCFDDFRTNGLLLPALDSVAHANDIPVHFGPHPKYNRRVADRLDAIRRECETLRSDPIRTKLAFLSVRALQRELRKAILGHGYGSIDDVMLMGSTDCDLEASIDRLYRRAGARQDSI